MFFFLQWGASGEKSGDRYKSKLHFNLAPQASSRKYTVLRKAEHVGSVKPFFVLLKYSDCPGKGHMPEKMGFLPEIGASSLSLLSVLTLQDNSLLPTSLLASKGHAACVRCGFKGLRLSYQIMLWLLKYNLLLQIPSSKPHSLLLPCPSGAGVCAAAVGRGISSSLPRSLLAAPATQLSPMGSGSAPHAVCAFDGLAIHI